VRVEPAPTLSTQPRRDTFPAFCFDLPIGRRACAIAQTTLWPANIVPTLTAGIRDADSLRRASRRRPDGTMSRPSQHLRYPTIAREGPAAGLAGIHRSETAASSLHCDFFTIRVEHLQ